MCDIEQPVNSGCGYNHPIFKRMCQYCFSQQLCMDTMPVFVFCMPGYQNNKEVKGGSGLDGRMSTWPGGCHFKRGSSFQGRGASCLPYHTMGMAALLLLCLSHAIWTWLSLAVVRHFTATPSSLQAGDVPSMNITFTPSNTVNGGGMVTIAVVSPSPVNGMAVFAGSTPTTSAAVVVVGLANCTNATGAIHAANGTFTITLPSSCVLLANVAVTVEIPSGFFAPNPASGTKVTLSLTTSADSQPSYAEYTTGMLLPTHPLSYLSPTPPMLIIRHPLKCVASCIP